jgi:thioredoxin 1
MRTPIEVGELNFRTEVLNSGRPVLVNFWAPWHRSGGDIVPVIEEIASQFAGRLKICVVDAHKNPSLTKLCFIETLPTTLYFADGLVRDRFVGVEAQNAIAAKLKNLLLKP